MTPATGAATAEEAAEEPAQESGDGDGADRALAPGGSLAAALPGFEDRPQQRRMATAVAAALSDERALMVEAGTGTGKTLAYLIPAIESGRRVVVSTGTRALQDQIVRNDLPLLRRIVGRPFSAVALKGVSNYVCRRKLEEVRRAPALTLGARARAELDRVLDWVDETATGDRADLDDLAEAAPVWSEITTTPEARLGPRCPHFERCFVTAARRAADRAELILVNHHLYFADLAVRASAPGARVLPDHDAVVFDEAHQLEDVATEHFAVRVSSAGLLGLVRDARLILGGDLFGHGAAAATGALERASAGLFAAVRTALLTSSAGNGTGRTHAGAGRIELPPDLLAGARAEHWFATDTALEELARVCDLESLPPPPDHDEDERDTSRREQIAAVGRRARAIRDDLAELAEQRERTRVYWGELRAGSTVLTAAPISVADLIRERVVRAGPTPVFTSATLTVAGEFDYTRDRLGLDRDEVDELRVTSPFDYRHQALLYVARDLPVPNGDGLPAAAATRITELLALTGGRAFVLFTSHRALDSGAARLAGLPYPLLRQGDAPRAVLLDRFRATPGAVLLGTGSFWEGVDVPGDALSLVIIDKLPFAPHTDPLLAARTAAAAARGLEPFEQLQLPQAALTLRQGFGRLIRRRDDRGVVAILDPRIVTRTYGRVLLASLPAELPRTSAIEQVRRWLAAPGAAAPGGAVGDAIGAAAVATARPAP